MEQEIKHEQSVVDRVYTRLEAAADAARALAAAVSADASMDDFNAAIGRLNDSKTAALNLCDAAY